MRLFQPKIFLIGIFAKKDQQIIREIFALMPSTSRRRLVAASLASFVVSFLDLIGVALIGILGSLTVNGIRDQVQGNRVTNFLEFVHIKELSFINQVLLITSTALGVLLMRTILSVLITKKTLQYLSHQGALISAKIFRELISSNLAVKNRRTTQETQSVS